MKLLTTLVLGLLTLTLSVFAGYRCYNNKCKNYNGTYSDCDQEYYYCDEGDFSNYNARCTLSNLYQGYKNYAYCLDSDECEHDYITGEAKCVSVEGDEVASVIFFSFIGGGFLLFLIVCSSCFICYCTKTCCFKGHQGRVINRNTNNVQMTTTTSSNVIQQYPPGQYPPQQHSPYPPPGGSAYPPQQGYPPQHQPLASSQVNYNDQPPPYDDVLKS